MDLASSAQCCLVDLQLALQGQGSREAPECCGQAKQCVCCGGWRRCVESCFGYLSFQVVAVSKSARRDGEGKEKNPRKVNGLQVSNFLQVFWSRFSISACLYI